MAPWYTCKENFVPLSKAPFMKGLKSVINAFINDL